MLFTSVCDSLSSQVININRRACHISSSSSCKTVKGIICDANCRSEESTCGVSWMLCSSSQCAAWARRSKIMREAKTPCRTPWNLVMAIAISDSERQTSYANELSLTHLVCHSVRLKATVIVVHTIPIRRGELEMKPRTGRKRVTIFAIEIAWSTVSEEDKDQKYPKDVPRSDSAYSKLPFHRVDASLLTVRTPVERDRMEWYTVTMIAAACNSLVEDLDGNDPNRSLSSNSAELTKMPIIRRSTFVASSTALGVDLATHTLLMGYCASMVQVTIETTASFKL